MREPIAEYLLTLRNRLLGDERYRADVLAEVEDHLCEAAESFVSKGTTNREEAELLAIAEFGSADLFAKQLPRQARSVTRILAPSVLCALAVAVLVAALFSQFAQDEERLGVEFGRAELWAGSARQRVRDPAWRITSLRFAIDEWGGDYAYWLRPTSVISKRQQASSSQSVGTGIPTAQGPLR